LAATCPQIDHPQKSPRFGNLFEGQPSRRLVLSFIRKKPDDPELNRRLGVTGAAKLIAGDLEEESHDRQS
jgi:hypothetical protein